MSVCVSLYISETIQDGDIISIRSKKKQVVRALLNDDIADDL